MTSSCVMKIEEIRDISKWDSHSVSSLESMHDESMSCFADAFEERGVTGSTPAVCTENSDLEEIPSVSKEGGVPRLVSVHSMKAASCDEWPISTATATTPSLLQALKHKNDKKRLGLFDDNKSTPFAGSILDKLSPLFRQSQHKDSFYVDEARPTKRCKTEDNSSAATSLHEACRNGADGKDLVKSIVERNPTLVSHRVRLSTTKTVYDAMSQMLVTRHVKEIYSLPLNLALQNRADMSIIETLIRADPSLLTSKDGSHDLTPLHVLLKHHADYETPLSFMLLQNPEIAAVTDSRNNTPLHYACMYGASLDVVRHLCMLSPDSLFVRNRDNATPMHIAQRSSVACSADVASYLWKMQDELH